MSNPVTVAITSTLINPLSGNPSPTTANIESETAKIQTSSGNSHPQSENVFFFTILEIAIIFIDETLLILS